MPAWPSPHFRLTRSADLRVDLRACPLTLWSSRGRYPGTGSPWLAYGGDHGQARARGVPARQARARTARGHGSAARVPPSDPGLRREEVTQLAHISVDHYSRLEQARGRHPSQAVLTGIARAPRLSDQERAHLFRLADKAAPEQAQGPSRAVDPGMLKLLEWRRCTGSVRRRVRRGPSGRRPQPDHRRRGHRGARVRPRPALRRRHTGDRGT
ncbi:helix-turn-helix domain-containing protein [Streptomyces umbrinus]|uniref:helix-turn-helix domain-containing protein n=1 Tax=Streptomyces umbrinus TaxID=67370 RepID=UPI003C2F4A03